MTELKTKFITRDSDHEDVSDTGEENIKGPVENAWNLKVPKFSKGDMKYKLQEESSFSVLYPKYREQYIRKSLPLLSTTLREYSIKIDLDAAEGRMTVSTSSETWDPYIIIKARDMIRLFSRSVPVEEAVKVLNDDITSIIVNVKKMVRNKQTRYRRMERLVGPNGTSQKALELLTNCYVMVQGTQIAIIGPHQGVLEAEKIVLGCMRNIHPVYGLKALMIKKKLMENTDFSKEDWSRFIPVFTNKKSSARSKHIKRKKKKPYTPFPPPMPESKLDKEIAEGRYFLSKEQKYKKKKKNSQGEVSKEKKHQKKKAALPPVEKDFVPSQPLPSQNSNLNIEKLKKKTKKFNQESRLT